MSIQGLNTSYTAIRAAQAAMDTISHNIANASTKGYTRQRVDLTTLDPRASGVGILGQGVDIESISRQRDTFLDDQARGEQARLSSMTARADLLAQAEVRFGELDAGIDVALSGVFSAFEELALHPESTPVRTTVLDAMDAFASRVQATATALDGLSATAGTDLRTSVGIANDLTRQIAELNGQITNLQTVGTANDLMDQRDRLVDDLATLTGASAIRTAHGGVRVSIDGLSLVDGMVATQLSLDAGNNVVHPDGPITLSGELGGVQRFFNEDLPAIRADLDQFATDVATAFNTQHAAGFSSPGVAGGDLFDASSGARGLAMVLTSPADLAAAGSTTAATFDGENAAAMADLRTVDQPGGGTLLERFREVVTGVGVRAARGAADVRTQESLAAASEMARESAHGVSLDEEMASLIAHQRALEAAARVMSAVDEALSTLINRTGVVGR